MPCLFSLARAAFATLSHQNKLPPTLRLNGLAASTLPPLLPVSAKPLTPDGKDMKRESPALGPRARARLCRILSITLPVPWAIQKTRPATPNIFGPLLLLHPVRDAVTVFGLADSARLMFTVCAELERTGRLRSLFLVPWIWTFGPGVIWLVTTSTLRHSPPGVGVCFCGSTFSMTPFFVELYLPFLGNGFSEFLSIGSDHGDEVDARRPLGRLLFSF
ncbi:hypothetical protein MVEN_02303000 [Mycena venus]|uniref:Uncharacterized protein n=1 Tax=Mycena venus TaxID=2733690 RepID=A0A8H7CGL9_9AGAR|nr:hypothetical protein MVEN_02303000 [Mycena venus]